jgi:ABC-type spermidine/putrescine transport system permease subunit I
MAAIRSLGALALLSVPIVVVVALAVAVVVYISLLSQGTTQLYQLPFTGKNYLSIALSDFVQSTILRSIALGVIATLGAVALGYAGALYFRGANSAKQGVVTVLFSVYMVSFLVKMYALQIMLAPGGIVNSLLMLSGITAQPLQLLGTEVAVVVGLIYTSLPIAFLVMLSQLDQISEDFVAAAAVFGAGSVRRFFHVLLPLSLPGVLTCIVYTLPPSIAAFEVPMLLGRGRVTMMSTHIYNASHGIAGADWPLAAALSIALLVITTLIVGAVQWGMKTRRVL